MYVLNVMFKKKKKIAKLFSTANLHPIKDLAPHSAEENHLLLVGIKFNHPLICYSFQFITNFLILLWLVPDDFNCQGETSQTGNTLLTNSFLGCTLLSNFTLAGSRQFYLSRGDVSNNELLSNDVYCSFKVFTLNYLKLSFLH